MGLTINEAQIICAVLMGLITLKLTLLLPKRAVAGSIFNKSRWILAGGTFLLTIHFFVQYILHKPLEINTEERAMINLAFYTPASFCVNMSLICLQRRGAIKRWQWIIPLLVYLPVMAFTLLVYNQTEMFQYAVIILAICYSLSLIYCNSHEIISYYHIRRDIREKGDHSLEALNKWSKWYIIQFVVVGNPMPALFFIDSLMFRAIYMMLIITIVFFYIITFLGYGVSSKLTQSGYRLTKEEMDYNPVEISKKELSTSTVTEDAEEGQKEAETDLTLKEKRSLTEAECQRMEKAVSVWLESRSYLKAGLTVQAVADEMNVPRMLLNTWLHTTKNQQLSHWITYLRIEEAKKQLLLHPDWSNESVAKSCGFTDRSYFQRQFRNLVGTTPSKWIEEHPLHTEKEEE